MQLPKIETMIELEKLLGSDIFNINKLRSGTIFSVRKDVENSSDFSLEKLFGSE